MLRDFVLVLLGMIGGILLETVLIVLANDWRR